MSPQSSHAAGLSTSHGEHGHEGNSSAPGAKDAPPFNWTRRDTDAAFAVLLALDATAHHALADELRSAVLGFQDGRAPSVESAWTLFEAVRLTAPALTAEGYSYVTARGRALAALVALAACGFTVLDVSRVRFGTSQGFILRTADTVLLYEHGVFTRFATMRAFPALDGAECPR